MLVSVSDSWKQRSDFIGAVERGEKKLNEKQSAGLLRLALDVEAKRSAAIEASRDLLIALSVFAVAACVTLVIGIRSVPREHWPRFNSEPGSALNDGASIATQDLVRFHPRAAATVVSPSWRSSSPPPSQRQSLRPPRSGAAAASPRIRYRGCTLLPRLGVRVGAPQKASFALGVTVGEDWQSHGR